ncbi:MAG: DUF4097 family beta strand repeat protein [Gemmatimonadetes bacterium]|nr:DUF4097 family beta strand repeat protein [Gemmatimonadota bacterium]
MRAPILLRTAHCALLAVFVNTASAQQRIDRRIALSPDASIRVVNLVGSIKVIGWDKDSLVVTGILPPGAGKFFYFGGGGRGAKLGVDVPEGPLANERSDLAVYVPAKAKLWIKAATADIEISDFRGGLDLYSVSGSIRVQADPEQVNAESMDGTVEIRGKTSFARVKTASGNITLGGFADEISATTVSGVIAVEDEGFQRARFESVTGDIRFSGTITRGGSLNIESHSGNVDVAVPASTEAEFQVNNFQGTIKNGLTSQQARPVRERGGRELSFVTGLGGADVSIRNFKGSVVLRKQ